ITTTRRKTDYSLDVVGNGKTKVIKHGTKEITRDGFEYELTVNFELINDKHLAKASKDRTSLFIDKPEFIVNTHTGRKLLEWCTDSNEDRLRGVSNEIERCETVDGLKH
ncbi:AAA family ATPase, partial [Aquimarina celericrescens]|nr:AAA family ATPase [Aquimarina celericrescens]